MKWLSPFLLIFLVGCTGVVTPETPNEKMAAVEISYNAALKTIEDLTDQGLIVGENATKLLEYVIPADAAMEAARAALKNGTGDVSSLIATANQAVFSLRQYLLEIGNNA